MIRNLSKTLMIFTVAFALCSNVLITQDYENDKYRKSLKKAYGYYLKGYYSKAIEYYRESINTISGLLPEDLLAPESDVFRISVIPEKRWIDSVTGIQNCLIGLKRYQSALIFGRRILKLTGYNKTILLNNAYCSNVLRDYPGTVRAYRRIYEREKTNSIVVSGLFWAYYFMGDVENAPKFLQLAVKLDRKNKRLAGIKKRIERSDYPLVINSAYYNYVRGNFEKALKLYEKALEIAQSLDKKQRVDAAVGIQNCLVKQKIFRKAIIVGENILFENPENFVSMLNIAFSYFQMGSYGKSAVYYNNLHRLFPKRPDALISLAWCYFHLEEFKKSRKYLKKAMSISGRIKTLEELEDKLNNVKFHDKVDDIFDRHE